MFHVEQQTNANLLQDVAPWVGSLSFSSAPATGVRACLLLKSFQTASPMVYKMPRVGLQTPPVCGQVVAEYKRGCIITGWPQRLPRGGTRQKIKDPSKKSLRKLAFWLENSPVEFEWMITLTFRKAHDCPKIVFRRWFEAMPFANQHNYGWAWFAEFQSRGVIHFHVFLSAACVAGTWLARGAYTETVNRDGTDTTLLRGAGHDLLVAIWIDRVADTSAEFAAFQHGGIIERLRSQDGAARYASTYAGKHTQKELPPGQEPIGAWWWVSAAARPQPEKIGKLYSYPHFGCSNLIFDKAPIGVSYA